MTRFPFGRSEIELLTVSVIFQIISLFTLFRVATGVASENPQTGNSTSPLITVPNSINQSITIPNSTPQFVSPIGTNLDASLVVALIFVSANVVVIGFLAFLYRKKKMKWFSLLVSLFMVFVITELYFSFLTGLYSWIPIVASIAALAITILAALRGSALITNVIALVVALELGSSFPVLLPTPLNWIIPAVYSLFDIYAVYYGRLGKLVRQVGRDEMIKPAETNPTPSSPPKNSGMLSKWPDFGILSINLRDMEIGMADIAFYTMVPAIALILNSIIAFIVVMIAVDAGILLSFTLFRKSEVSPGLPVPILLGLGALLVVSLII